MSEDLDLFSVKLVLTPLYYVRLVVCTVLLVPIRLILLVLAVLTTYTLVRLITICMSENDLQSPFTGWRRGLRHFGCYTVYLWYWAMGFR